MGCLGWLLWISDILSLDLSTLMVIQIEKKKQRTSRILEVPYLGVISLKMLPPYFSFGVCLFQLAFSVSRALNGIYISQIE